MQGLVQNGPADPGPSDDFQLHHPAGRKSSAGTKSTRPGGPITFWRREEEASCTPSSHLPHQAAWPGSQDVVSKAATRRIPMEGEKDSAFPKFESKPQSQEVRENQTVKFRCEVSGIPKPGVAWFLEGTP